MGFKLHPPVMNLKLTPDAVRGGLAAWGEGELEVKVRGDVSLESYFDLIEVAAGNSESPAEMRKALSMFADLIVGWSVEDMEPSAENFHKLPYPLALGLFGAWAHAGEIDPNSAAASTTGEVGAEESLSS